MQDMVSIVVPVYNVENFLDRCVQSIVSQTYPFLEILLIDDGSTDACRRLCDDWAEKDSRIRVIHKNNAGLGMARNTGLEHATGKYVLFVDSDDYILPHTVEKAFTLAEETEAEIVLYGMNRISRKGTMVSQMIPKSDSLLFEGDAVLNTVLPALLSAHAHTPVLSNIPGSACSCLYTMELIRRTDWRFVSEREIISEDVYSLLMLYRDVRRVAVLQEACYCYCENGSSLTQTFRADRFPKATDCYLQCVELCRKNGYPEKAERSCVHLYLGNTVSAMKQAVSALPALSARARIREMLNSDVLQSVFRDRRPVAHTVKWKVLFWSIRNRQAALCWLLAYLQICCEKGKR